MILITDRDHAASSERRDYACVFRLGEPFVPPASLSEIVCKVALDDLVTVETLRGMLRVLRSDPQIPVRFILRDGDIVAHALANALGATSIAIENHKVAGLLLTPTGEVGFLPAKGPDDGFDIETDIATLVDTLATIFRCATARTHIDPRDVDDGATILIRSLKEAGISRWVDIVRRYDDATYQHCLLVAGLTAAFAAQLGFTMAKQRLFVKAALQHDIGKARSPIALLTKAGPLTPSEQARMRRHPSDGYYMLTRQGGMEPCLLDVVLHHHEMLDGTGYPNGLRGDQIPAMVRIATICDIQAALIERRPYRPPMAAKAAYDILVSMGGKLDIGLVETFGIIVETLQTADDAKARASA